MDAAQGHREQREFTAAMARWRAAENRLYPLALVDTDAYQDVVTAVGRVLAELRRRPSTSEQLLHAETDLELLALAETGLHPMIADPGSIVAAACAQRSVELAVRK
jgi:hypothetical protein